MATRTTGQALTEAQQLLVMEFYKFTKGRGHHLVLKPGKHANSRAAKLQALKLRMVKAGVPGEITYGDVPNKESSVPSWCRK